MIIDLQRRMRQLGEIRLGRVVDTGRVSQKTGRPILRPEKLNKFRFTSASRPLLEQVAALYGGTVQEWTPANGGPTEWEVYSEVDRVPVIVPAMQNVIDSWYEQYKGSRCVRRCDGETEQKSDQPCLCDPNNRACQITTRLNVMLRDVKGLGVWLLTTHGYYASTELPAMAEALLRAGGEVDGFLTMEEKKVPLEDGTTARFMVPKLDVELSPGELYSGARREAIASGQRTAVGQPERTAIEAPGQNGQPQVDTLNLQLQTVERAGSLEILTEFLQKAIAGYQVKDITGLPEELQAAFVAARERLTAPAAGAAAEGADALWAQIVAAWPGDRTDEIEQALVKTYGMPQAEADAQTLAQFLADVKAGHIKPAGSEAVPF